jgi:hypothetical protein
VNLLLAHAAAGCGRQPWNNLRVAGHPELQGTALSPELEYLCVMHTHRHGHHFAPDAKVADYVQGLSAKSDRSLIFARVTCGGIVIHSTHVPMHMHVRIVCSAVRVQTIVAHSDPPIKNHLAGTATRDLLSGPKDLAKIENRIPPPGFQSATSQQVHTEHNPWHARTFANARKTRPPRLMTI